MADEKNSESLGQPDAGKSNETDETSAPKISIIIKTASNKESIDISQDASISDVSNRIYCRKFHRVLYYIIQQLREKVAEKFKADLECVCLIFAGKILKDFETLETHSTYSTKINDQSLTMYFRN